VSPTSGLAKEFGDALAAEHAAIFGYGVLGAHLDANSAAATQARTGEAVHRDRRDALVARLTGAGATPVPAGAVYAVPFPVTDKASALHLAVLLEALVDSAVRATAWRRIAGISPATVSFPGKTG
jgi:hypothetical protein